MPVEKNDQIEQQRIFMEQKDLFAAEQQKKVAANLLRVPTPKTTKKEKTFKFSPVPQVKIKNWDAVIEAYRAQFGIKGYEKSNTLEFASREDAILFFDEKAQAGHEFLACEVTSGYCVFSCGSKKLYQGSSLERIQEELEADSKIYPDDHKIKEGLELISNILAAQEAAEKDAGCNTTRMREQLQGQREKASSEEELEQALSPVP